MHSPAVLSPDLYLLPDWVRAMDRSALPRLWLDIGYDDTLLPKALDLRQALDKVRWPYTWTIERGEHSSSYWSPRLRTYLRWYAEGWPVPPSAGAGTRYLIAPALPGPSCLQARPPGGRALEGGRL